MTEFRPIRWLLIFLLSLLWTMMGSSIALAERGEFGHSLIAAKTTGWGEQAGAPHVANVTVRGPDGKIVHQGRTTSGSMTPTEKEIGFPQGQNASHTEAKTVMDPSIPYGPGNTMTITGWQAALQFMQRIHEHHAEATGTKVRYQWRQNGKTNRWETGE
jgi:Pput_2613-like deaminase